MAPRQPVSLEAFDAIDVECMAARQQVDRLNPEFAETYRALVFFSLHALFDGFTPVGLHFHLRGVLSDRCPDSEAF